MCNFLFMLFTFFPVNRITMYQNIFDSFGFIKKNCQNKTVLCKNSVSSNFCYDQNVCLRIEVKKVLLTFPRRKRFCVRYYSEACEIFDTFSIHRILKFISKNSSESQENVVQKSITRNLNNFPHRP